MSNIDVAFGPLQAFTERAVKGIILGAAANLTEDTPVDTGHASNNWVPSLDSPFEDVDGSEEAPSRSAQAAGIAAVAAYELPQVGYVANNVPYIGRLNEGSSSQAPSGFVEAAVLRAIRTEGRG
jgi:hypothetical protein